MDYLKTGEIIAIDTADDPQWAEVRIDYITPQGMSAGYTECAFIEKHIITNTVSNDVREYPYAQYVVGRLEHLV